MQKAPDAPGEIPALVYAGLTIEQEAQLFYRLQKERRGINSFFRFRAAVMAGEPEAIAIRDIAERAGWTLGANNPDTIGAVAALEWIYRRDPEALERTLAIYREAWPVDDERRPAGEHIRALGFLLLKEPDLDDERMVRRISIQTPSEMKRRASALREGSGQGGASPKYMASVIQTIYNKRS